MTNEQILRETVQKMNERELGNVIYALYERIEETQNEQDRKYLKKTQEILLNERAKKLGPFDPSLNVFEGTNLVTVQ